MKKFRNGFCFTCALFLTSNLHAQWQKNWLAGISADYVATKAHLNTNLIYTTQPLFPITVDIEEHSTKWIEGGGLIGYQWQCAGWIFGAELSVEWHNDETYHFAFSDVFGLIGWSAKTKIQNAPIWGFTGRFAYEIAPYFIPFMRAGLEMSKDDLAVTFSSDPLTFPFSITIQEDQLEYGYLVGFGFEVPLPIRTCPIFRLEYNYHAPFHSVGLKANGMGEAAILFLGNTVPINPSFSSDVCPISQSGKISIVWKFF